jgi:hypothetical protein
LDKCNDDLGICDKVEKAGQECGENEENCPKYQEFDTDVYKINSKKSFAKDLPAGYFCKYQYDYDNTTSPMMKWTRTEGKNESSIDDRYFKEWLFYHNHHEEGKIEGLIFSTDKYMNNSRLIEEAEDNKEGIIFLPRTSNKMTIGWVNGQKRTIGQNMTRFELSVIKSDLKGSLLTYTELYPEVVAAAGAAVVIAVVVVVVFVCCCISIFCWKKKKDGDKKKNDEEVIKSKTRAPSTITNDVNNQPPVPPADPEAPEALDKVEGEPAATNQKKDDDEGSGTDDDPYGGPAYDFEQNKDNKGGDIQMKANMI